MHSEQRGGDKKNDAHGPRGHVVKSFGCGGAEIAEVALLPSSMAATLVALLAASWAPLQTGRHALLPVRTRSLRAATPCACGASDEDKLADAISTCRSMRVSELKAELSLLSLIHISEPTRRTPISYAVFCLKKKKKKY